MDCRPIGVFDSGIGGVSTLREAMRLLPEETFVYYGDHANAPYGGRSGEEICALTLVGARRLEAHGVKAILVACNTATAASIDVLQETLPMPVVGIEPAILEAEAAIKDGLILMLATQATTRLARYKQLREHLCAPERVIDIACPAEIVKRVEHGELNKFADVLHDVLAPYEGACVQGIVLGCTHYPFICHALKSYAHAHFKGEPAFFDGNHTAAHALRAIIDAHALGASTGYSNAQKQSVEFMTSGDAAQTRPIFERMLTAPLLT